MDMFHLYESGTYAQPERPQPYDDRYRDMEYLLLRGNMPKELQPYFRQFQPVRRQGSWSLLKNGNAHGG